MKVLECSERAENIINRKNTIFYIETVLNFFVQLRKIFFLRSIENKIWKFLDFFGFFWKSEKKVKIFQWKILTEKSIFLNKFSIFEFPEKNIFPKKIKFCFRSILEKIFFGVEKKSWGQLRCKKMCSFDLWCFQRVLSTLTPSSKHFKSEVTI